MDGWMEMSGEASFFELIFVLVFTLFSFLSKRRLRFDDFDECGSRRGRSFTRDFFFIYVDWADGWIPG
jgi:hypothetical protein